MTTPTTTIPTAQAPVAKAPVEKILDNVMSFIKEAEGKGELKLPSNYSAVNALKSAWLSLQETVDKDKKPVLEVCSRASVIQALLRMVTKGLSLIKGQCYFIAYGGELKFAESYQGKIAIAKRVGNVTHVHANAIYEKDTFEFEVDSETGIKKITNHTQTLESISDGTKIKGAYCYVTFGDGRRELTIMTKEQIVKAWNQRQGEGLTKAHNNFTDEMACKTVTNRSLKQAISTSDDSDLFDDEDHGAAKEIAINKEIKENANTKSLTFDDHEEVTEPLKIEPTAAADIQNFEAAKKGKAEQMQLEPNFA